MRHGLATDGTIKHMVLASNSCTADTTSIKLRVVNGVLSATPILKPPPAGSNCVFGVDNPDRNGLVITPTGLSVNLGKGTGINLYKDCSTQTVYAQPVIRKMNLDTSELNGPANFTNYVTNKTFNGLYLTDQGMQVLVGVGTEAVQLYVDVDSKEIRARLRLYGEQVTQTGIYEAGCNTVANRNALRSLQAGASVLVSGNPPTVDPVSGRRIAGPGGAEYLDGGIRTWFDCSTNEIKTDLVLAPDDLVQGGTGGAAGCNALRLNAITINKDGVMVRGDATDSFEIYASCDDRSLLGRYIFAPSNKNSLTADGGLKLNIATKSPAGFACNGISVVADPAAPTGTAGTGGLWARPVVYGYNFKNFDDSTTLETPSTGIGQSWQNQRSTCLRAKNDACVPMTASIHIRGPVTDILCRDGHSVVAGYHGQAGIGGLSGAYGQEYAAIKTAPTGGGSTFDPIPYTHMIFPGFYERLTIDNVQPGQEVFVSLAIDIVATGSTKISSSGQMSSLIVLRSQSIHIDWMPERSGFTQGDC